MAYIQKNTPPPNVIHTFSLQNFAGGLNNRSNILEVNQCSDVINMAFTNDDVMEKRRGSTNFDSLSLNGDVTYIDEYKPYAETDIMVRATKTEMYVGNTKVKDLAGQVSGTNFAGKYFFADGGGLYVYGKFPQTGGAYVGIIGTASPNYVLMEVVTPPAFTPLDATHVEGKTQYDYTNRKVWYEPCKNEIEDTFKQGNVVPSKPRFVVVKSGRLFISGSDKDNDNVYISDVNKPYYYPASLPMQLPPNSDRVAGLSVYDNAVICGRREDVHFIVGNTNRTDIGGEVFQLKRLNTHTGFANHYSVSNAHNYLFFLGSDGNSYALSNVVGNTNVLATTIISKTLNIFEAPINLSKNDIYEASSYFFEDNWYLTMKDKILIYNYRTRGWTMYNNLHARSFYNFHNVLIWGDNKGRTSMPSEDYLDYGIPYHASWTSKQFDMDDANAQKQFREFFLVAHTFNDVRSDIRLNFEVDYVDVKSDVVVQNQMSIWGRAVFGDRFITRNINASLPFVIGRRGRNIRFTFTNGYTPDAPVATYDDLLSYLNRKDGTFAKVTDENAYYLFEGGEWSKMTVDDYNQTMRIYQVNGEYEYRGKR